MSAEDRNGQVSTDEECTDCTEREHSFDTLTRRLADGSISRRKALRVLGASLVGSVLASIPGAAIAAPPPGTCLKETKPCKTNTDCCSQNCETRNGKLVCGPAVQCTGQGQGNCPQPASECLQVLCSASGFCGAAQPKPNNTRCDLDNNPCTEDTCQAGVCTPGGVKTCPNSNNPCAELVCNPATGNCEPRPVNAGGVCRPAQGACDLPALCTGTSIECPDNPLKAAGTVCRPAAGDCDVAEVCTGTSNQCPNNEFAPEGTPCRAASGACEGIATCTGNGATCPDNPLVAAGTVCRPAAGDCDVAEVCTGTSNQCPNNEFAPAGTVCRDPSNQCEVAATCTGNNATCPPNGVKTNGTPCDRDNNLCTLDTCQNGVCQAGSQVQCPTLTNPCKVSVCAPATGTCVEQNAPNTTLCSTDLCRTGQTCNNGTCQGGTPKTCPVCQTCSGATGTCVPVTCTTTPGQICCLTGPRAGTCGVAFGAPCTSANSNCCTGTCKRNANQACRPEDTGCLCRA